VFDLGFSFSFLVLSFNSLFKVLYANSFCFSHLFSLVYILFK
jgi:hypothetical protein